MNMNHLKYLADITEHDIECLLDKERTYQGSWKKRGGVGAAMMILRKMDRLEVILKENGYDIFDACLRDIIGRDGSAMAEIRDLRRYLLLVESEVISNSPGEVVKLFETKYGVEENKPGTPEDGGHHERQIEE